MTFSWSPIPSQVRQLRGEIIRVPRQLSLFCSLSCTSWHGILDEADLRDEQTNVLHLTLGQFCLISIDKCVSKLSPNECSVTIKPVAKRRVICIDNVNEYMKDHIFELRRKIRSYG